MQILYMHTDNSIVLETQSMFTGVLGSMGLW